MDKAVIQGTFADLKSVKTRSVVQMVVEIPIEQAEQVVKAFGFPQPGAEIAVAVARLDPEKAKATPAPSEKPKERFADKRLSVQAGMRCSDGSFQLWLEKTGRTTTAHPNNAAEYVRMFCCEGHSRSFLDNVPEYGAAWAALNAGFEQDMLMRAEQR